MTNSHRSHCKQGLTEAKLVQPVVSLYSFPSWFASHMHILHLIASIFTSAPARALFPTETGLFVFLVVLRKLEPCAEM